MTALAGSTIALIWAFVVITSVLLAGNLLVVFTAPATGGARGRHRPPRWRTRVIDGVEWFIYGPRQ